MKNFKHMVSTNMVSNCPISVAYIINDEKVYGISMEIPKGKLTMRKIRPVIKDYIKIPIEIYQKNQTLSYALMLST